jgi:penicillin amidase
MNILYGWNDIANKTYIAPTIYKKWFEIFQSQTWDDEFTNYSVSSYRRPMITILENLTKFQPNSHWFDNIYTAKTETRNDTMLLSLNNTVAWLQTNYGAMTNWIWGDHHKIYVESVTGLSALSSPKIPIDGGSNLINNQWETGGPSWRMDVNLGNATTSDHSVAVYPGGESGNPMSAHYLDLFYLYIDYRGNHYQYHIVYRSTIPITVLEATWVFNP